MLQRILHVKFPYSFEEFSGHLRAMKVVRQWEYTCRFGFLGTEQSNHANTSRVIEYFADSYPNSAEALFKAEVFLFISDYLARNETVFTNHGFMEKEEDGSISVEKALLQAVHSEFTLPGNRGEPNAQSLLQRLKS